MNMLFKIKKVVFKLIDFITKPFCKNIFVDRDGNYECHNLIKGN